MTTLHPKSASEIEQTVFDFAKANDDEYCKQFVTHNHHGREGVIFHAQYLSPENLVVVHQNAILTHTFLNKIFCIGLI